MSMLSDVYQEYLERERVVKAALSASEERERVLVEGDDSVLSQAHIALCWVQEKMPQFYPDMIQRIKKQCGIALDEYEARAALATPAPEQQNRPCSHCGHSNPHTSPAGRIADGCNEAGCYCAYYVPAQPSAEKAGQ